MAETLHLPPYVWCFFLFCLSKSGIKCVVWRGEENGVKKTCRYRGKSLLPSALHQGVEVALAPVTVVTGGSSAVFQHWENNCHTLTNPSDLCLISKTLLMIKYFQNTYVINFSPKFYSLQRESGNWIMLEMFLQNTAIMN